MALPTLALRVPRGIARASSATASHAQGKNYSGHTEGDRKGKRCEKTGSNWHKETQATRSPIKLHVRLRLSLQRLTRSSVSVVSSSPSNFTVKFLAMKGGHCGNTVPRTGTNIISRLPITTASSFELHLNHKRSAEIVNNTRWMRNIDRHRDCRDKRANNRRASC